MNYKVEDIKEGIKLHTITTEKFKTNLMAVFITTPLNKENVTKNAMVPAILRRGSLSMPTSEDISIELEEMYGASFDCGVEKTGDNQVLKFYLETINNEFLPNKEDLLSTSIDKLLDIVFNPVLENDEFKQDYIKNEKENLKQIIESKIDNKTKYAETRCTEEMYKNEPYGLYKYGYTEDLSEITAKNLYEYYKKLLGECKIDIFVSGKVDNVLELIKKNDSIQKLNERQPKYNSTKDVGGETLAHPQDMPINTLEESMNITQGKLSMGLDINDNSQESKYVSLVYNAILGGTPTSKLFQNVREKEGLAYYASSSFLKTKNNIFIRCGIEIENYEKTVEIIKKQLEDMKNGSITEEEIQNAKNNIIATIKFIPDEQDTEITYYFGQELSENNANFDEYIKKVENVQKQDVIDLANKISINTIYFLKN